MDNTTVSGVKELLNGFKIYPKKGLGQHFLVDKNILKKIVDACQLSGTDTVLEIGTGLGALTLVLADEAGQVITLEIDKRLEPVLRQAFAQRTNINLVMGDVLALDWQNDLPIVNQSDKLVVCANLPYYITSPIIFNIIERHDLIKYAVLMIQREVADRLLAVPGTKEYGLLTVMVSWRADVYPVTRVSRRCFYPAPEVDSTVVKLVPGNSPRFSVKREDIFIQLVREAFQKRRKTMQNVLAGIPWMDRAKVSSFLLDLGIDPQRRGETLTVEEFARIANELC